MKNSSGYLQRCRQRSLRYQQYVYLGIDGVNFKVQLGEDDRQCVLVVVGATADDMCEMVVPRDATRASERLRYDLLLDL